MIEKSGHKEFSAVGSLLSDSLLVLRPVLHLAISYPPLPRQYNLDKNRWGQNPLILSYWYSSYIDPVELIESTPLGFLFTDEN